jgi:hypothetical protein
MDTTGHSARVMTWYVVEPAPPSGHRRRLTTTRSPARRPHQDPCRARSAATPTRRHRDDWVALTARARMGSASCSAGPARHRLEDAGSVDPRAHDTRKAPAAAASATAHPSVRSGPADRRGRRQLAPSRFLQSAGLSARQTRVRGSDRCRARRRDDDHGAGSVTHALLAHRSEHGVPDAAVAMPAEDEQVRVARRRSEHIGGAPLDHLGRDHPAG